MAETYGDEAGGLEIDPEELEEKGKTTYVSQLSVIDQWDLIKKVKDLATNGKDKLRNLCCPFTPSVLFGSILATMGVTAFVGTITAVVIVTNQNGEGNVNSSLEVSTPSWMTTLVHTTEYGTPNSTVISITDMMAVTTDHGSTKEATSIPTTLTDNSIMISTIDTTDRVTSIPTTEPIAAVPFTTVEKSTQATDKMSSTTSIFQATRTGLPTELTKTSPYIPTTTTSSEISSPVFATVASHTSFTTANNFPPPTTAQTTVPPTTQALVSEIPLSTLMTTLTPTTTTMASTSEATTTPMTKFSSPMTTLVSTIKSTSPKTTLLSTTTTLASTTLGTTLMTTLLPTTTTLVSTIKLTSPKTTMLLTTTAPVTSSPFTTETPCSSYCADVCTVNSLQSCPCDNTSCEYQHIGCFGDSSVRAIPTLEGTDQRLDGVYSSRINAIEKCASVARDNGYAMFAIQNGGWCASGCTACQTYATYGPSVACAGDGKGGGYANDVYIFVDQTP
uniref:Mucin-5AC-like n=1 Tax=Saccoglossus kowalevskii TaxID=10224 RepID=A0ABM0LUL1_SACKO|nr:PREDICTED: mucin-5AC-like [Saccoglossus kowalevskii]